MLHLNIILPNLCNCECNTLRSKIADAGLVSTVFISAARKQRKKNFTGFYTDDDPKPVVKRFSIRSSQDKPYENCKI